MIRAGHASIAQYKALAIPCPAVLLLSLNSVERTTLTSVFVMQGHSEIVGDIAFLPGSSAELASVGDDSYLLFWDTRSGTSPMLKVEDAHKDQEIQCMDWSSQDTNMLATGTLRVLGQDIPSAAFIEASNSASDALNGRAQPAVTIFKPKYGP